MGQVTSSGRSPHLWPIYHRTFATVNGSDESDELFLHGYGDSDEPEGIVPDNHLTTAPVVSVEVDDDYPIECVHANLGITGQIHAEQTNPTFPPSDRPPLDKQLHESLNSGRQSLDSRYPPLIVVPSECSATREDLRRCYAHESDLLDCAEEVSRYAECAKASIIRKLVK